jgi:hypothetical protein
MVKIRGLRDTVFVFCKPVKARSIRCSQYFPANNNTEMEFTKRFWVGLNIVQSSPGDAELIIIIL